MPLRKLNEKGIDEFAAYLQDGAQGSAPISLLDDNNYSQIFSRKITPQKDIGIYPDRYVFGNMLNRMLKGQDPVKIAYDQGLWTGLALLWFDYICPILSDGKRKPRVEYHYIFSKHKQHTHRHLIRSPWQMVRIHGKNARFMLIASREKDHPLSVRGDILHEFGSRQELLENKNIIAAMQNLYFDPKTNRPKVGISGKMAGSARRFGVVFNQLKLTYDLAGMKPEEIDKILPEEFDRWRG